jgi:CelD/BcsL family acetyltransferase involved in cellulose biosynthesis
VRISVIHPRELGAAEIAAWRSMQARTEALANPFLSPDFTIAVGQLRPEARVAVLAEGPDIVGFFPFERRKLGTGVPIAAGLTDCQGLIHAPEVDWQPRMLLRACGISAWRFDHLVAGQRPFERYQMALAPSPIVNVAQGFDAYYATLKASYPRFCRDIARRSRKSEREVGEARLVPDSRDVSALHTLMAWKSDQYRRTGRLDRFSQPWIVSLLETMLATRNEQFSGMLFMLYAGDVPVAANFCLRSSGVMAGWFTAYDTNYARYSPGLALTLRMIEAAAGQGVHRIDMGKGNKDYKDRLKNDEIFVGEGIITRRSPLGAASYASSVPVAWAIRKIRRHRPLFNAADALLRRYGQIHKLVQSPSTVSYGAADSPSAEPEPVKQAMP